MSERHDLNFHLARLDAWLRELWETRSIDLHRSDGTTRNDQSGLLQNIRDDVMVLRRAYRDAKTSPEGSGRDE